MLVLSRKKNESIVINNDITIVVVDIRGDKVRLGVEAPKEIPVHRREVYDAIQRENRLASQVQPGEIGEATDSRRGTNAPPERRDTQRRQLPADPRTPGRLAFTHGPQPLHVWIPPHPA